MAKGKKKTVLHFPPVHNQTRYLTAVTVPQILLLMAEEEIPLTAELVPGIQYDEDGYVVTLQWATPIPREDE